MAMHPRERFDCNLITIRLEACDVSHLDHFAQANDGPCIVIVLMYCEIVSYTIIRVHQHLDAHHVRQSRASGVMGKKTAADGLAIVDPYTRVSLR